MVNIYNLSYNGGVTAKTYNQYCAIAHALDVVGERWSLLVVRNLLIAPQRFSDLRRGLPDVSTNILTDRLKSLEKYGVIATRYLPPPAASTVYELTEHGRGLTEALAALARWGSATLGKPKEGQSVVMESVCFMLQGVFWRDNYLDIDLKCNVYVQDREYEQTFGVVLDSKGVEIAGPLERPALEIRIGLKSLNLLSSHQKRLEELVAAGGVELTGSDEKVESLYAWVNA